MTPFLKTVTTHTVQEAINQSGPMLCLMSVVPDQRHPDGKVTSIDLVIGAHYTKRCASAFNKKGVLELAALLAEIGDAMDDHPKF
jgi:hypothetical protein